MEFDCLDAESLTGFDWDDGNVYKNEKKHGLHYKIIEEVFFNEPLLIVEDFSHSLDECRCVAYGRDNKNSKIMVVFTVRENYIRVISARNMTKKERSFYENHKTNPYL
ncbi:MAG TPA: BrnT family toxin [Campylobacterales bacterium]|nr:BrnT family toxin [Campylobacterales bacterium]